LAHAQPEVAGRLELVVVGRSIGGQDALLEQIKSTPCRLTRHSYLPHTQALSLMWSADALCVLLADVPGAERLVPPKIFEYMAAQRPILAIAPHGELCDMLQDYPAAQCYLPRDSQAIAAWLARATTVGISDPICEWQQWDRSRFNRCEQAGQLAKLLDAV